MNVFPPRPATARSSRKPILSWWKRAITPCSTPSSNRSEQHAVACDEIAGFRSTYLAQRAIESIGLRQTLPIPIEKNTPCIE